MEPRPTQVGGEGHQVAFRRGGRTREGEVLQGSTFLAGGLRGASNYHVCSGERGTRGGDHNKPGRGPRREHTAPWTTTSGAGPSLEPEHERPAAPEPRRKSPRAQNQEPQIPEPRAPEPRTPEARGQNPSPSLSLHEGAPPRAEPGWRRMQGLDKHLQGPLEE